MKNTLAAFPPAERKAAESRPLRYQIYRQARAGNFMLEFKTDSAFEALENFAMISPAYEGGAIRLWDEYEQRTVVDVEWKMSKTALGLSVSRRTDVFHDRMLAEVARQSRIRNEIREEVRREFRMTA